MFGESRVMNNNKIRIFLANSLACLFGKETLLLAQTHSWRWKKAAIVKGGRGGGFENRTGELHKFPFAGHDRFRFPQFFYRILGEAYKFCRCLKDKVDGGKAA